MDKIKDFFAKMKAWAGDHPALAGVIVGLVVVGLYWFLVGRKKRAAAAGQPATLASYSPGVAGSGGGSGGGNASSGSGSGDTGQTIDPNLVGLLDGMNRLYNRVGDLADSLGNIQTPIAPSPAAMPDVQYPPAAAVPAGGGMNVPSLVFDVFKPEELGGVVRGDFDLQRGGGLDSFMSVFTNDLDWAAKVEANPNTSVVPLTPGSKFVQAFRDPVSPEKYAADRAKVSRITGRSGSIADQLNAPTDHGGASDQAKLQTLISAGLARSGDDPIWGV
jgi:hypothetical protein